MRDLSRTLAERVDVGIKRARVLTRTEVISAHAEATLNSYTEAGLEGVEIDAEFSSTDDNKRCPKCADLERRVYTIAEARGVIPVHPNCRCAFVPVVRDPSGVVLR
jgi:SPP1 gp7 family putative phage head morphogenesis protein